MEETAIAHEAPNLTEADLVVGLLQANGIPAAMDNESATVMLDGYVGAQRIIKVRVPRSALEESKRLIAEASAAAPDGGDDEEE